MKTEDEPKILFIDIETAPLVVFAWQKSLYGTNISTDQVISDTHLLSFSAKWLNKKEMIYADQRNKKKVSDDYGLLLKIAKLLGEADVVIAHNGRAFDTKF